jgi:signal peptidase I
MTYPPDDRRHLEPDSPEAAARAREEAARLREEAARVREDAAAAEAFSTPEPLVPMEPWPVRPAMAPAGDELRPRVYETFSSSEPDIAPPPEVHAESIDRSWRSFGTPTDSVESPAVPDPANTSDPQPGAADTTIGTLGDEPMGGVPREEPGAARAALQPEPRPEPRSALSRAGEELFAWLKTLASAAVYATLIVTFGFQVARVEGQSMAPTLSDQDRLIVNKLAYRLGSPQVGDIVMLYYPLNPEKSFVKRVIAEEGDQIRIVNGQVFRNDVLINDDYVPAEFRSHDDYGPEVVPQGYYFVMGDHRNNSSDSRHWKFVPKKYIIGKVQLRWWPIPSARIF